ncbi:MAG TPA: bifunctional nuclease family protein [bacterium]
MSDDGFTEMTIYRLVLDPNTNSPIVILQDKATNAMLPIWIGIFEAHAIAMKLEGVESARPMTHDLLKNTFGAINALVERVEVVDLVDNTYFARIQFILGDKRHAIDSRPSDAIALALRAACPIFVANHVLESSKIDPAGFALEAGDDENEDEWTRILKNYKPGSNDKAN